MLSEEEIKQLQWGRLQLALEEARYEAAGCVEGVEAVEHHDQLWDNVLRNMEAISGYTRNQLTVFASKVKDLNEEAKDVEN